MLDGVAMTISKSMFPDFTSSARSSIPILSAPASFASAASSPSAKTAILRVFPVPLGSAADPLMF